MTAPPLTGGPPRFTVVIPVYNVEEWIGECLASLIAQDFDDWEAVVIDDHGTDTSMEQVRQIARSEPRLHVVDHGENRGLGDARNTGVERARGDYLLFLDSDDVLEPGTLSAANAQLADNPVEVLIFDHVRLYPSGRRKRSKNRQRFRKAPPTFTAESFADVLNALAIAPGKVFDRRALKRAGVDFPRGAYEDVPWTFVVLALAQSISWMDHLGYVYRQRPGGSILNTASRRHFDVHGQYRLLFARLDRPDVATSVVARIYSTVARHLWLIVSPVTGRVADSDRPDFVRASSETLWAIRPSSALWLKLWKEPRHAALATGSPAVYRAVRARIKSRRKRLKARAVRNAGQSAP